MDQDIASAERDAERAAAERRLAASPPPPKAAVPQAAVSPASMSAADLAIVDPAEHNVVFTSLVTGDQDVVGLVAYSIYKQNKYDWLMAFSRDQGRMPNEADAQSYLLGESTTRRLATYRHLAEATLDGRGIEVPGSASPVGARRTRPIAALASPAERGPHLDRASPAERTETDGWRLQRIVLVCVIAVIVAILGLLWLLHGGPSPK